MKVKFTKASQRDKELVTLRVKQLPSQDGLFFRKGMRFIVTIEGVETIFSVNRDNLSMTTKAFPRRCRLPSVGKPVFYNCTEVEVV